MRVLPDDEPDIAIAFEGDDGELMGLDEFVLLCGRPETERRLAQGGFVLNPEYQPRKH